jgi:hypothetical protein
MDPTTETPALEILKMESFLCRVMTTAPASILITGNPETDENTDLVKRYEETNAGGVKCSVLEMLDKMQALEILTLLWEAVPSGDKLALARQRFSDYIGERQPIYP